MGFSPSASSLDFHDGTSCQTKYSLFETQISTKSNIFNILFLGTENWIVLHFTELELNWKCWLKDGEFNHHYLKLIWQIWLNVFIAMIRCVVSMCVNAATVAGDEANIILFIGVRFFLLATEMSVVTFAILFGTWSCSQSS